MSEKADWERAWEQADVAPMPDLEAPSGIANARWGFEAGYLAAKSEQEAALLPDDKIISIVCDENGEISDHGESVERTAAEWAAREGRGLLASSEY